MQSQDCWYWIPVAVAVTHCSVSDNRCTVRREGKGSVMTGWALQTRKLEENMKKKTKKNNFKLTAIWMPLQKYCTSSVNGTRRTVVRLTTPSQVRHQD